MTKDFCYEDGVTAKVKEHKHELCELIREAVTTSNNAELIERAYYLEELARFLNELEDKYMDDQSIRVDYNDGLNHFIAEEVETYRDKYEQLTTNMNLSAKQYFGLLRLAMGDLDMSSQELANKADEDTYKKILIAMGEE